MRGPKQKRYTSYHPSVVTNSCAIPVLLYYKSLVYLSPSEVTSRRTDILAVCTKRATSFPAAMLELCIRMERQVPDEVTNAHKTGSATVRESGRLAGSPGYQSTGKLTSGNSVPVSGGS